jgi:hypothetical protein
MLDVLELIPFQHLMFVNIATIPPPPHPMLRPEAIGVSVYGSEQLPLWAGSKERKRLRSGNTYCGHSQKYLRDTLRSFGLRRIYS